MPNYVDIPGIVASGTVVQYRAVRISGDRTAVAISDADAPQLPIGILQNDPASGEACDIAHEGVARGVYGDTVTAGQSLACNNDGLLIPDAVVADGSAVDLYHVAKALEGGAVNEVHDVLVFPAQLIGKE